MNPANVRSIAIRLSGCGSPSVSNGRSGDEAIGEALHVGAVGVDDELAGREADEQPAEQGHRIPERGAGEEENHSGPELEDAEALPPGTCAGHGPGALREAHWLTVESPNFVVLE